MAAKHTLSQTSNLAISSPLANSATPAASPSSTNTRSPSLTTATPCSKELETPRHASGSYACHRTSPQTPTQPIMQRTLVSTQGIRAPKPTWSHTPTLPFGPQPHPRSSKPSNAATSTDSPVSPPKLSRNTRLQRQPQQKATSTKAERIPIHPRTHQSSPRKKSSPLTFPPTLQQDSAPKLALLPQPTSNQGKSSPIKPANSQCPHISVIPNSSFSTITTAIPFTLPP